MAPATIAIRSLGLSAPGRLGLARLIQRGVPFRHARTLRVATGLPERELAAAAGIPYRTWMRRKHQGRFSGEESDRLARVARLFDLAETVLGSGEAATAWLGRANVALGGEAPLSVAATGIGAAEVEALLVRLEHGVVS